MAAVSAPATGRVGAADTLDAQLLGEHMEPSMELLKFYRSRIKGFEAERNDMIQRMADVEVSSMHCG
jgi:hypothetical protein